MPAHYKKLKACVDHNYQIIKLILQNVEDMFENRENESIEVNDIYLLVFIYLIIVFYSHVWFETSWCIAKLLCPQAPGPQPASEFDMDKVKTTLKQFVRDWSSDGKPERDACYIPVLDEIEELFPADRW